MKPDPTLTARVQKIMDAIHAEGEELLRSERPLFLEEIKACVESDYDDLIIEILEVQHGC